MTSNTSKKSRRVRYCTTLHFVDGSKETVTHQTAIGAAIVRHALEKGEITACGVELVTKRETYSTFTNCHYSVTAGGADGLNHYSDLIQRAIRAGWKPDSITNPDWSRAESYLLNLRAPIINAN